MTAGPPDCSQNRRVSLSCSILFSLLFQILFLPRLLARASVRTLSMLLPSCFLSLFLGVGREASKAQRVRRVRPQDVACYGIFLCVLFCFAVPFRTAGGQGYVAPSVELGKLEVSQRTPDTVPVRPGPVRGLSRPLGRCVIRSYVAFMFLRLHLLSQPVRFCLEQVGWWFH